MGSENVPMLSQRCQCPRRLKWQKDARQPTTVMTRLWFQVKQMASPVLLPEPAVVRKQNHAARTRTTMRWFALNLDRVSRFQLIQNANCEYSGCLVVDQPGQHGRCVWATVDVIAKCNHDVFV